MADWAIILLAIIGGFIVISGLGVHVAVAFLLINMLAVLVLQGEVGLYTVAESIWPGLANFDLLPIPMFVLMGEFIFRSGVGFRMIQGIGIWLGRLPGRLSLLAVAAGTVFGAMSGSSVAGTALLGSVLLPEMDRHGYKRPMSIGPIMGSGGLATIIPPSTITVILAGIAAISVGGLLIASIIPGLVLAALYATYIIIRCSLQPSLAPSYEVERPPLAERLSITARDVLPTGIIVFSAVGVIFVGIATPTEAAALGALGALAVVLLSRSFTWDMFWKSLGGTLQISSALMLVIAGSQAFGSVLAYSGSVRALVEWSLQLPLSPVMVMVLTQLVLLFLGCFMGAIPMIMITIPIFMPIVAALGFDPIWFAILFLINIEMGQTTPPFGLVLFAMKGVAPPDVTMGEIVRAGLPFLGLHLLLMVMLFVWPEIALWLPAAMKK
jgi:tripartite ATP-independent transporter DctM subunit